MKRWMMSFMIFAWCALLAYSQAIAAKAPSAPLLKSEETAGEDKGFTVQKTLRGEVSGISSTFLAITFAQDAKSSYEMTFTVPEDVKLKGKEKLKDINTGDTILVRYEETTQSLKKKDKEGKEVEEVRVLGRVVKEITFVKAAPQMEPEAEAEPESVTGE